MSVIWYKVWSDLWDNKVRTLLAVLSIAIGVFAIGATFGMANQMLPGMDAAHQAVNPSHINMFLADPIDEDVAIGLKSIRGVKDVEVGATETVRYKLHPDDEWDTAMVYMRQDYTDQSYDVVQLKKGAWPEERRYGIERLSSQHFGVDIGDTVIFEVDNRPKEFPINGLVRHPFVPPPQFGGQAVFLAGPEGMVRFGLEEGEYSQVMVQVEPYSAEFAREIASKIKDRLGDQGYQIAMTFYQDPKEHWGRFIMVGINMVLQVLAVISLLASVVLVLNTMTALITQQTDQIGIIKAIGGTTGRIIKIYLTSVVVYGTLALLISLPLGAIAAYATTRWLLNIFNIDYATFQYSREAVIIQVVSALGVPLLAALWPILSGATITVREAIASYGLGGGNFGSNWFDRMIEYIGRKFLSAPYAIALGNMFRRKGRLILTQLVLITAGAMFLAVMSLSTSIDLTIETELGRRNYDIILNFEGEKRRDRTVELAEAVEGVEKAELWFEHNVSILPYGQRPGAVAGVGATLTGVPNGSDMFQPWIVRGRWLDPREGRAVVMLKDVAEEHGFAVGDMVTLDIGELGDSDWQIVGLYQSLLSDDIGSSSPLYANADAIYGATTKHNVGNALRVRTEYHNKLYVESMTAYLKDMFIARNMDIFVSMTLPELRDNINSQFNLVIVMLLVLAVIVAAVGGIGLMGSLSISVVERIKEIGVMRAIGAKTPTILGMFVMEGMLQGLLSWLIVVPVSFFLGRPMAAGLGQAMFGADLSYQYNVSAVIVWLVVILVISFLASVLPSRSATTISVRDSLAYQ